MTATPALTFLAAPPDRPERVKKAASSTTSKTPQLRRTTTRRANRAAGPGAECKESGMCTTPTRALAARSDLGAAALGSVSSRHPSRLRPRARRANAVRPLAAPKPRGYGMSPTEAFPDARADRPASGAAARANVALRLAVVSEGEAV
ncbi:hypothetical protein AB0878_09765 [Amycolatopsis sp. NPDC047767]|uniref:hypothetical protein n=1 Tax=Amycolatopsis sp. NPDC047767 TaxID=3156765 RepID=UPI0034519A55